MKNLYPTLAKFDAQKGARWTGNVLEFRARLEDWRNWHRPELVFVCSRSDLFHPAVSDDFIRMAFNEFKLAGEAMGHTFQVLTKRPERAAELMPWVYSSIGTAPLLNVWFGTTVGAPGRAFEALRSLARVPAIVRWISAEPLLGNVAPEFSEVFRLSPYSFHWVVGGGETARPWDGARRCMPEWARELQNVTKLFGQAFYWKQWGNWSSDGVLMSAKETGRMLGGRTWDEYPRVSGQIDWNTYFEPRYGVQNRLGILS